MIPKRRATDPISSTGRKPREAPGPSKDYAQRVFDETTQHGGSTMNLQLKKFAEVSEHHDPSKPEHFIVAGEPNPMTGERYPTVHARMPGHLLSSAQWESMSPETHALKPFSPEMAKARTEKLIGDREMMGRWGRHGGEGAALGTWQVPRAGEGGQQHERYGQIDLDVSSAYRNREAADKLARKRGEEAQFASNPMRTIPTVVGHALGMAYHPLDADLRAKHAKMRGVTDAA